MAPLLGPLAMTFAHGHVWMMGTALSLVRGARLTARGLRTADAVAALFLDRIQLFLHYISQNKKK